jgi:peptidoglycan hydrolase-like protein with peptidoglycan-binding domain
MPASAQVSAPENERPQDNILGDFSADNLPMLSLGSEGSTVRRVQLFLRRRGFYEGRIDGEYEFETRSAVRKFQRINNLADDGIIGPQTWEAMTGAGENEAR